MPDLGVKIRSLTCFEREEMYSSPERAGNQVVPYGSQYLFTTRNFPVAGAPAETDATAETEGEELV
jgi:hypothetical protein